MEQFVSIKLGDFPVYTYKVPVNLRKPILRKEDSRWYLLYRRPNGEYILLFSHTDSSVLLKIAGSAAFRKVFEERTWH